MKSSSIKYFVFVILFIQSCGSNTTNNNSTTNPMQAVYTYFDEVSKNELHFTDLDKKLLDAKGENKTDEVNAITSEFEKVHEQCIKKMDAKFPVGSIKLPFEQVGSKDTLIVKSIYVSGFSFPWNTALSICYYFTVEYDIRKNDIWYAKVPLTFVDSEGDILNICNVPANTSGKSRFLVKTEDSFRMFSKIVIH
jgi:hypothetical protein